MNAVLVGREGATPHSGMDLISTSNGCIDSICNDTIPSKTMKSATSEASTLVKMLHLVQRLDDCKAMDKLCKWVPKA